MAALLLIAHAPLASALAQVAAHTFADACGEWAAVDVDASMVPEQIESALVEALARLDRPETLILADVFGATPYNVALRLCDGRSTKIVAGVNVPMLWRALAYRHLPLETLVERATAGGAQGIVVGSIARPQNQSSARPSDDQAHPHHQ